MTLPLELPDFGERFVCGHDGRGRTSGFLPPTIRDICVGQRRVFASLRLYPRGYFSGYWPSMAQIAAEPAAGAGWAARVEHHPEELRLEGEQPAILNISNSGRRILPAMGYDSVLGLFTQGGTSWAVTEGCVAWFDETAGQWRRVFEPDFRFYWSATAAFDDGHFLFVGSDRGFISRLDLETGRFEIVAALKDRGISRIARQDSGNLLATSVPAPLGRLPTRLRPAVTPLDCDATEFDGTAWRKAKDDISPGEQPPPQWFIKRVEKRHPRDKSQGNFLWGPRPGGGEPCPRYYVKEVFFPEFLCASPDGKRLWLSTFDGIVCLDIP